MAYARASPSLGVQAEETVSWFAGTNVVKYSTPSKTRVLAKTFSPAQVELRPLSKVTALDSYRSMYQPLEVLTLVSISVWSAVPVRVPRLFAVASYMSNSESGVDRKSTRLN